MKTMDVFLARQPIFNSKKCVVAYEILYRQGVKNVYHEDYDGDLATTTVVSDALVNFGIEGLTNDKKAFINFTKNLIMENLPLLIPPESLTIEILETVDVDRKFAEKIKYLKGKGYTIALDDFIDDEKFDVIMPYVDIIKVDFLVLGYEGRKIVADKYKIKGIRLLAEKVETYKDFEEAVSLGYELFQGFFFEKPVVCRSKGINVATFNYMEILKETVNEEPSFEKLSTIVKSDMSLTYKLLRLINSPAFYRSSEITSINHALTMLGLNEIRKWVTLIMLRDVSSEKPEEIIKVSLIRAIFSEQVSPYFGLEKREMESFLLGLFSLIDTIMERPLFEVLEQLPLKEDVKSALMGVKNPFHDLIKLLKYYEKGNWDMIIEMTTQHSVDYSVINQLYLDSVIMASKMMNEA
ncbi:EAL and HDOD domain-containing protein [Fusibacter sp. 3D3]|uniref:EAL and HDOD domain-containing protein n=1 Tax=Fusibacter sp. 3D3 TaxID=1048380 RepID=UPI000856734A|nr:HDOD domain-containing protein [Fusibacter sp. 3D3]GAU79551.1 predicted signal transduction protein [Fusibacter sp. 3D3]